LKIKFGTESVKDVTIDEVVLGLIDDFDNYKDGLNKILKMKNTK